MLAAVQFGPPNFTIQNLTLSPLIVFMPAVLSSQNPKYSEQYCNVNRYSPLPFSRMKVNYSVREEL